MAVLFPHAQRGVEKFVRENVKTPPRAPGVSSYVDLGPLHVQGRLPVRLVQLQENRYRLPRPVSLYVTFPLLPSQPEPGAGPWVVVTALPVACAQKLEIVDLPYPRP